VTSLNKHDQEWAKNFVRSFSEKYGRHNSSTDCRPNITREPQLQEASEIQVRYIGQIAGAKQRFEDCSIGEVCVLEAIRVPSDHNHVVSVIMPRRIEFDLAPADPYDAIVESGDEALFEKVRYRFRESGNGSRILETKFWKRIS
jgi:hypothetical protein